MTSTQPKRSALLLNPGEASGEYKDPENPWDVAIPRAMVSHFDKTVVSGSHADA
eukprot:CAMPEP_0113729614 /NCGR_PEP_ID=MMETSP0038_2-20120614/42662_1 /TAXON_ID=2898 /ORGANISM="Cryptomonas paramecium" /LENGTH=53 /DNA_ID=CAMNT_0000661505 /DNA_START=326 /DNA_END=488 /DNA_ORIENTATION=+ /assembly_acc=CAM_ASM_000170